MNSRMLFIWFLALGAALSLLRPLDSEGRELTLEPSISVTGRYDDNVTFNAEEEISDYSSIIQPAIGLYYKTELTKIELDGIVRIINYIDETDLDSIDQIYTFEASTYLSERFFVNADLSYIKDTLLDSELEETGRVFDQDIRERYNAAGGIGYELSEITTVGLDYGFSKIDYESDARIDRDENSFDVYYQRSFNDGRSFLTIRPGYRTRDSDTIDEKTYLLNIGWTHKSSEIGTIKLFVGGRSTEQTDANDEEDDTNGVIADLSYQKKGQRSTFRIGYKKDIGYDANATLNDVNRFYAVYRYRFTERLRTDISINYYITNSVRDIDDEESRFFDIHPSLRYSLTERLGLTLDYRYSQEEIIEPTDVNISRNRVMLSIDYNFPVNL